MVQIPVLTGVYGKTTADFERSVPVNLSPIAEPVDGSGTGISKGYLRLISGIRTVITTDNLDRGGYVWKDQHLRVIGSTLYAVDGNALVTLGSVANDGKPVTFAEGFGRVGIASSGMLYYWDATTLTLVTDTDLGAVKSLAWSDGYFITTDGDSIIATELNDPTAVDPLKYGSSEADPDPVIGVLALRGEVYALNRYTIEKFLNGGTTGFPFLRSRGSQIPKGVVGAQAFTPFVETFAFCGSARNETPSIYLAGAGQAIKISLRALDEAMRSLSDDALAAVQLEATHSGGLQQLLVHLPAETWVYHWTASQLLDIPVWSKMVGGAALDQPFSARNFTLAGGQWWCGGANAVGVVDDTLTTLFGQPMAYRFDTPLIYNDASGAVVHSMELVALTGRGAEGQVGLSYTDDGVTWSQERFASTGGPGQRNTRPAWRRLGRIANWRGFRFKGIAKAPIGFARLEAALEPLNG